MSKAEDMLNKIKGVFAEKQEPIVKLSEVITSDGLTVYFEGELVEGSSVWVAVEGENVPLAAGEYTLPDGTKMILEEDGIVSQLLPKQETEEESPAEAEAEAEAVGETVLSKEDVLSMIKKEVDSLKTELSKAKEENEKLKVELSTEPAVGELKQSPEGKDSSSVGVELSSKTEKTGLDRVYEMLYNN
jgi:hypothetical protein